jgi:hypothetical protein
MIMRDTINPAARDTIARAAKAIATMSIAAISKTTVRIERRCDAGFNGEAWDAGLAELLALADLDPVLPRLRVLAKAIPSTRIESTPRHGTTAA